MWRKLKPLQKVLHNQVARKEVSVSGTFSIPNGSIRTDDSIYDDDELTPVRMKCLVCDGRAIIIDDYGSGYSSTKCGWCNNGAMSSSQINQYLNRAEINNDALDIDEILRRYVDYDT